MNLAKGWGDPGIRRRPGGVGCTVKRGKRQGMDSRLCNTGVKEFRQAARWQYSRPVWRLHHCRTKYNVSSIASCCPAAGGALEDRVIPMGERGQWRRPAASLTREGFRGRDIGRGGRKCIQAVGLTQQRLKDRGFRAGRNADDQGGARSRRAYSARLSQ